MKLLRLLSIALILVITGLRAEERPSLPENVTLANGSIIRKISVVKWEKDRVVLKHAGGVDGVRYTAMAPEYRAIFEAARNEGLEAQEDQKLFEKAIRERSIVVGMSREQVTRSWGKPEKINASGGSWGKDEQWVYIQADERRYVYFRNGLMTSWQH